MKMCIENREVHAKRTDGTQDKLERDNCAILHGILSSCVFLCDKLT